MQACKSQNLNELKECIVPELKRVIIAQPSAYLTDPHQWVDSKAVLSIRFSMFEALVKYDKKNSFVPGLAEHWDVKADARTWIFNLRKHVKFHDGSDFTAQDAAESIRRAVSTEMPGELGTAALLAGYLGKAEIEVLDELTLRMITPEPMADLLDLLVYIMILPCHTINQPTPTLPGTGPYRLREERFGEIHLSRFEDYWAGPAPVKELVYKAIQGEEERVRAFLQHKVDLITQISPERLDEIKSDPQAYVWQHATSVCVIMMFNALQGACMDVRVRQALNYAVDMDEIVDKVMKGHAVRLNGPLTYQHAGCDPDLAPYAYDPEHARELLSAAGYANGLTLTLDRPTILPDESPELAAMLRTYLAAVGVTLVERIHADRTQYSLLVRSKQIGDLCIFDSSPISTYRVLREKLHSRYTGPWWQGYDNPLVNSIMEQAWATVDTQARNLLYREAYHLIQQDAPWLFFYNPTELLVVNQSTVETLPGWSIGFDGLVVFGQG
jgi:peptide/nickel transport system substrate-binding protein